MKKWFLRIAITLILVLSLQGPELISQYIDHLTGHVEELKYQVGKLQEITGKDSQTLKPLIADWVEKEATKEPGLFISALFNRFEKLSQDLLTLKGAKFWSLPPLFIYHFDGEILRETLLNYRWGVSLTFSVIPFLLLGILFSALLAFLFRKSKKKSVD